MWRSVILAMVCAATLIVPPVRADEGKDAHIRIGFVDSLFKDSAASFSDAVIEALGALVRGQTGLDTKVMRGGEAHELSERLKKDLHVGIFQGVEFAWARMQHPELRPLVLAINDNPHRHALLVVRADSSAAGFDDLKGKSLIMPLHSRAHCELFLEKNTKAKDLKGVRGFFSSFERSDTAEDALDDLVDGDVQGVVVDAVALQRYQERKPGRWGKIKVVKKSEAFPASVVAYRPGRIDDQRLKTFKAGLLAAHKTILGHYLMTLWKLSAFEPVPQEYEKLLANIREAYPPPK